MKAEDLIKRYEDFLTDVESLTVDLGDKYTDKEIFNREEVEEISLIVANCHTLISDKEKYISALEELGSFE